MAHDAQGALLLSTFLAEDWERDTLGQAESVPLTVPWMDQAKPQGATWDAVGRTWRVRRQADMGLFARWLPNPTVALP